ncbi:MAG: adenosine kinase [Acidimicrobiia bacterium]|nr:adenosine kinase [Acidimicrobiia bacterium]
MGHHQFDVVGIGNAIVDITSREDHSFLEENDLVKGSMTLVDAERSAALYEVMAPGTESSGGSAANTMAGLASFGSRAGFIGKVREDQLGEVFRHDIRAAGVSFEVLSVSDSLPTARCLVVVTPDAARTMSTFLGVSSQLHPDDIDTDLVSSAKVLYCEGYIWDVDITKQAIRKAINATKAAGNQVSFTLSDSFCVERHHAEWHDLVDNTIDILFGNEAEICSLYETDDFDVALEAVRGRCPVACLTRSEKGSLIVTADDTIEVAAVPVDEVVDTSGAGDMYAAGFLHGYTSEMDLRTSAELGSAAAAEVIGHLGARPEIDLAELAARLVD